MKRLRKKLAAETKTVEGKQVNIIAGGLILFGLYLAGLYNYLLFHSLAEIFSIVVAFGIFMVAWHSHRMLDNHYLLFIGIGYLFVGGLDLIHTLAYKGMGVFQGDGANIPTQLWIAARYVESLSLFIAPLVLDRKLRFDFVFLCYALAVIILLGSIFDWNIFPVCYVEGIGLTPFKKISEYLISMILVGSIVLLNQQKKEFERNVFRLLVASIIVSIGAELVFTFYVSLYGLFNLIGHWFKIISFYLIYKAIVRTGLERPADILFFKLKQSEKALKESELKYKTLVENSLAGIYIHLDDKYVYVNERFAEMCGYTPDELLGKNHYDLTHPDQREMVRQRAYRRLAGEKVPKRYEILKIRKNGEAVWHELLTSDPIQYQGKPAIMGHEIDISRRKQAEVSLKKAHEEIELRVKERTAELERANQERNQEIEERMRTEEALRQREAQLQQARKMEAVGTLAGGIAHEFNNALVSVTIAAGMIEKNYSDHYNMAEYIEPLKASADRMVLLIRRLLAYAEKGKYIAAIVSLNDLVQDALTDMRHTISPSIRVETNLAHDILNIKADPAQIRMVTSAVVANAVEATEGPGRIRIVTGNQAVDEEFAKTRPDAKPGRYACLSVEDEGKGMDEEILARIFDPFFSTKFKGRGLGMAAVYGIVKNHGGWTSIDSEPGRGTAVRIYLPAVDARAEESNEAKK